MFYEIAQSIIKCNKVGTSMHEYLTFNHYILVLLGGKYLGHL